MKSQWHLFMQTDAKWEVNQKVYSFISRQSEHNYLSLCCFDALSHSLVRTHSCSLRFFLSLSFTAFLFLSHPILLFGMFPAHCFCSIPLLLLCNLYSTSFSRWSIQQVPQKQKIYALSYRCEVKTKLDISICKIIWNVVVVVFAGFFLFALFVCLLFLKWI